MSTCDLFCDECGAANQHDATVCYACQQPLPPSLASLETPLPNTPLPQTVLTAIDPGIRQFELHMATGSIIEVTPPVQASVIPLLHQRYQVLRQAGSGGFGAVYQARDLDRRGRMVAIKAIALDTLSPRQAIEATDTFNRELGLLSDLEHPNLPHLYEHFIDANHWYLVMDFIDGDTLDRYMQQETDGYLPVVEVVRLGIQLCEVLRYLHELEPPIIFRDVKPENIMRTPGGHVYLIDFGIARRFKQGQARDTLPLGSPGFAAPEQYGRTQTDARTDIYGLGTTLYSLLTGYDPSTTPFLLPPILSLSPDLPESLATLIGSMIELDPAARPANIVLVQQQLFLCQRELELAEHVRSEQLALASPAPPEPSRWQRVLNSGLLRALVKAWRI